MKLKRGLIGMALLIGWMTANHMAVQAAEPHFGKATDINFKAILPAPPASGSAEDAAEMETILRAQATRTEEEVARAKSEITLSPTAFQSVLGKQFTAKNYPELFSLLEDAGADSKLAVGKAKEHFGRPRPQDEDSRVQPLKKNDDGPSMKEAGPAKKDDGAAKKKDDKLSYPSGHSTEATLWMYILCQIAPDKQEALLTRSQEIGWDRVIAGAHHPSDVYAGRVLGKALARALRSDPTFQARFAKAKAQYQTLEKFRSGVDNPAIRIPDAGQY